MTSISWRDHLYGYKWELMRAAYFKKYGREEESMSCRVLAQIHKNHLKDDQLEM